MKWTVEGIVRWCKVPGGRLYQVFQGREWVDKYAGAARDVWSEPVFVPVSEQGEA